MGLTIALAAGCGQEMQEPEQADTEAAAEQEELVQEELVQEEPVQERLEQEEEAELEAWMQQIKDEIESAEAEADRLDEKIGSMDLATQMDLNQTSFEIYTVWDDVLNTIWGILKENMEEASMEQLTEEEQYWISRKEAAVQEAGALFEGGSAWPLVVNSEAAKLTRYRVYELAAEAGVPMDTQIIYDGCYFNWSAHVYKVSVEQMDPSLSYCEIQISNVQDTTFDFTVDELMMTTDERTTILQSSTAVIQDGGRSAVYEGEDFTLTFHFASEPASFPKELTVTGWDKLEGDTFINKNVPGHESG